MFSHRQYLFISIIFILTFSAVSFLYSPVAAQSLAVSTATYRGDINEDGQVNIFDLLGMLSILSSKPENERQAQIADMDASDSINIFDLLGMLKVLTGAEEPQLISFEPDVFELIPPGVVAGDTVGIIYSSLKANSTEANTTALFNDKTAQLLSINGDTLLVVVPETEAGFVKLINQGDTTSTLPFYLVERMGIIPWTKYSPV